jgi:hypothetical protein
MKRILVLVCLLASYHAGAQDNFDIKWNVGNLGYAVNLAGGDDNKDAFVDILNIGIEHIRTRVGIEYSPFRYTSRTYFDNNNNGNKAGMESFSFINFNLYWNTFEWLLTDGLRLYIGPFNRVNYGHYIINDAFRRNEFVYTAGLRIGLSALFFENKNIAYNLIGGELGYKNISGRHYFTMAVNVDIILFLIGVLASSDSD